MDLLIPIAPLVSLFIGDGVPESRVPFSDASTRLRTSNCSITQISWLPDGNLSCICCNLTFSRLVGRYTSLCIGNELGSPTPPEGAFNRLPGCSHQLADKGMDGTKIRLIGDSCSSLPMNSESV